MKIVILCGGRGYRLKEETEFKPKPMVQIGDKPILWHIMKIYSSYGFNDFIIALGYKGDYIKEYFLNQKYFTHDFTLSGQNGQVKIHKKERGIANENEDFAITFVDTGLETLPGERILRIKEHIPKTDENFMVTYGDGVADINIKKLLEFHNKQGSIGTITGVHPRSKYGLVKITKNHKVKEFVEKPVLEDWVNGGYMVFKKDIFKYLRSGEMEHEALKRLTKERELSLFIHKGFWHAMDTYMDVDSLNEFWNTTPPWKIWKN